MTDQIHLTIIVDNEAADGLVSEHGYAVWLEKGRRKILFDTGDHNALEPNSRRLDKDLSLVTDLILSHGHYDHSGRVDSVIGASAGVRLYLHPAAGSERYSHSSDSCRAAGMPPHSRRSIDLLPKSRIHYVDEPLELEEGLGLTGTIARKSSYEDTGGQFFFDKQGLLVDPIDDDIALWLRTAEGLVICVGCSHSGIVNTVETVMAITGESAIHTIIGGLHLKNASETRLEQTVSALNAMNIRQLIGCHCTGDDPFLYLKKHLNCGAEKGFAGFTLTI